jgi:quercetin dioxygenase-like cupin family protein
VEPFSWDDEPVEQLNPRIRRQMLNGDTMTLARILLASGAIVPEHAHDNEQISTVISGRVRFRLGEKETVVAAGQSLLIPGGVPHRVEALEDSVALDAFSPRREDWISGDDAYLRGE